jgi:hypothetical protein
LPRRHNPLPGCKSTFALGAIRLLWREEPDILDFCSLGQLERILDIDARGISVIYPAWKGIVVQLAATPFEPRQ